MAQKTISIGFKVEDGEGGFKKITADAQELKKVMQGTLTQAEGFKRAMLDTGAVSLGIDAIANAMKSLQSTFASSVDAYNLQLEAETKLETVMRQRMAATDESIQSIKDLCSAQQQLGVIGDEIQLAGAQQIATFLTQKDALETLIPAMNNLVAQQKGLTATSGDAVNIANLLGKAMQGQTSALRRVGISFSEAEEKAVKYGTEQERAAALAKIITNNVGEMNAELAKTSAGQMKRLSNNIGDVQEKIGALSKQLMPGITMLNQFVMMAGNIGKLTTAFNALVPAITKSVKAFRDADVQINVMGKSLTATTALTKTCALAFKASMTVIKTALISTGIGAAIWAIGEGVAFLTQQLNGVSDAADDAAKGVSNISEEQENFNKTLVDAKAQLVLHIQEIKNFTGTKEEERKKVEELNTLYGDSMGTMQTLAQWYEVLTENSELYARQLVLQARAQTIANKIAQGEQISFNIKSGAKKSQKEAEESDNPVFQAGNKNIQNTASKISGMIDTATSDLNDQLNDLLTQLGENAQKMRTNAQKHGGSTKPSGAPAHSAPSKSADTPAPSGSTAAFEQEIREIETRIKLEPDPDAAVKLEQQKAEVQEQLEAFQASVDIRFRYERDLERIQQAMNAEPFDLVANLEVKVDSDSLQEGLRSIPAQTQRGVKSTKQLEKSLQMAGTAAGELGNIFTGLGEAMESKELNIAGIIAGGIANIVAGAGSAIAQASEMGPWAWAAFALAATAQTVAMISQLKGAAAFAEGGVVSGPTLALVGEYSGASNNPEVIAPLDKLRDLIEPSGAGAVVVTGNVRLKGEDIEIALENHRNARGYRR